MDDNDGGQEEGGWRDYIPSADVSNAVATLLLVGVGVWGVLVTQSTIETSERAWVGIPGLQTTVDPVVGQPIHYQVNLLNTGKEPATDVSMDQISGLIDPPITMTLRGSLSLPIRIVTLCLLFRGSSLFRAL